MFSAAELIESVEARYRRRFPLHAGRLFGEFPPTWRQWFLSIEERVGAVTGAPAQDFVAAFAKRPLHTPPRAPAEVGRLQALLRLLRQQWEPALREDRGMRRFAAAVSFTSHVCFIALLIWVAIIAIEFVPKKEEVAGEAVQVEFIGEGTPEDTGSGPVQGSDDAQPPASASAAVSTPAPAQPTPESSAAPQPTAATEPPPTATEPTPEPPVPSPPVAAQPLVVTEPRAPTNEQPIFALPPPQVRAAPTASRALVVPQLSTQATEIEMIEPRPPVRALERRETVRPPTTPELRERATEIEMFEPLPTVQARTPVPRVLAPQLRTPDLGAAPSEIMMREPAPPAPAATRPATAQSRPAPASPSSGGAVPTPSNTSGGRPAAPAGARPATAGAGVGPATTPRVTSPATAPRAEGRGCSTATAPCVCPGTAVAQVAACRRERSPKISRRSTAWARG